MWFLYFKYNRSSAKLILLNPKSFAKQKAQERTQRFRKQRRGYLREGICCSLELVRPWSFHAINPKTLGLFNWSVKVTGHWRATHLELICDQISLDFFLVHRKIKLVWIELKQFNCFQCISLINLLHIDLNLY